MAGEIESQSHSHCADKLKQLWNEHHALSLDMPMDRTVHMDYTVNSTLRSAANQSNKQRVQMWMTYDKMMVENDFVSVYSTSDYTAAVRHNEEIVNVTGMGKGYQESLRNQYALAMMDSLFQYYEVSTCASDDQVLFTISLNPLKGAVSIFNVLRARFLIDWNRKYMMEMELQMGARGNVEFTHLVFHDFDLNYKGRKQPIDFLEKYGDGQGGLTGKYKQFIIRDQRGR